MMEKKSNIDVPVALIFFNRPKELDKVFQSIKKAKPSKLFLVQDGPREHSIEDKKNIKLCRDVVKNIDWECDVKQNYSKVNLGCGKRVSTGISWAFEYVDRLIIMEDDCVPSKSFFNFCKIILEKYADDKRIGMISGMNHLGKYEKTPYDYVFSSVGSIAGWATWKRVWDEIDYDLSFLDNSDTERLIKNFLDHNRISGNLLKKGLNMKRSLENGEKLDSWSYQRGMNDYLNSALVIVPKVNLMSNIGLSESSVHSVDSLKKVPRGLRFLYKLKLHEIKFPLIHPVHVIEDYEFNYLVNKLMKPNIFIKYFRKIESKIYRIFY